MIRFYRTFYVAVLLLGFAFEQRAVAAVTVVLDFNDLASSSSEAEVVGNTYSNSGFLISNPDNLPTFQAMQIYGSNHPDYILGSGAALHSDNPGSDFTLTKLDGGEFRLASIDIGKFKDSVLNPATLTVNFHGSFAGGGSFSDNYSVSVDDDEFQTINFGTDFVGINSITWGFDTPFYQFDNVTLEVSAVPEPTTLAFLGVGLGVAGVRRVRRKRFENAVA
ncbi:putative signal peptide and transmembrane protein [Rhodopirellula islandica]|uniref:Signal peptide and transmembrane protein n=1 Tax=Rhodopirellula islandica TaxID=595434 RepID=A0A0J1B814_RHOIS|nr:PEP-CTERM sorting domain-containing protein [Rhodopirellula islandica]KLU02867.1 putative signal peptide and transmembrane protein [Rhodopirellula islandica]